jgi:hypothetical protein
MTGIRRRIFVVPLLFATGLMPIQAQYNRNDNFSRGMRSGGHGGSYYNHRDDRYYHDNRNQGGIGPGKGALIGGAGGAVLGAVFGGGLKGTIIGGAAGAGIGAAVGGVAQSNRNNDRYYRR